MRLGEIAAALEAELVVGEDGLDKEILTAGASDSVSDVLYFGKPGMLLLTGLTQVAVVRTADLAELSAVVFVRGKVPDEEAVAAAREAGLPLLVSEHSMYDCCGRLYVRGLRGVIEPRRPAPAATA
jgi:predicted transcriptional regulator